MKTNEDNPLFAKHFIKGTTTLLNNFPNNPFLLNDLTVINNTDMIFKNNIYCNLAQLLKTGEKKLHSFIEDCLIMSKQPISAKLMLNHFQLLGFISTKKQASLEDKRLSPPFTTNLSSFYNLNMLSCCFHLKYMITVKVCLRMVLICIMVSNPVFSISSNK